MGEIAKEMRLVEKENEELDLELEKVQGEYQYLQAKVEVSKI